MAGVQTTALVLRDPDGNYYVIPLETLQANRIPADQRPQLEEAVGIGDVSGFSNTVWTAIGPVLSAINGGTTFLPVAPRLPVPPPPSSPPNPMQLGG